MKYSVRRLLLPLFLLMLSSSAINGDPMIVLTFKHAPESVISSVKKDLSPEETQQLGASVEKECRPSLSGVPVISAGRFTMMHDGIAQLPLSWTAEKFYLVITPSIRLASLQGETKDHMELELMNNAKAAISPQARIFLCERKTEKAPETPTADSKAPAEIKYWSITEQNVLPAKLSPLSVVIIAQPKNLVLQTSEVMTEAGPHFIFPALYVVGKPASESLAGFTDCKRYLEEITQKTNTSDPKKVQAVIENR